MTAPAARASLAGALYAEFGDWAEEAVDRLLSHLDRDGWNLAPRNDHQPPSPAGPVHRGP